MKRALLLTLAVAALAFGPLAGSGCGSSKGDGHVDYSVSAQQNYERGLKKLKDEDWIAAHKYFSFIKARFPYSKYAVLAELRMADAEFGAEHYLQAIDAYKQFVKFHPSNEMTRNGYAAFRVCQAYVKMLPDDFWLLPPSYEKDQTATTDSHRELAAFLKKYPGSPEVPKAKKLLTDVNRRLAEHEMYVAKFYWDRGKPMGTVLRLRRLLDEESGVGFDEEALYLLGKAYIKIAEPRRARQVWERLVKEFPTSEHAAEVRGKLARLSG